jgi:hypothetical protein
MDANWRVHAPQYHETLFSRLYPGKQQSSPTYPPLLEALASTLPLSPAQRARTVIRSDAGFGSDANVDRALQDQWQVLTKGQGGRRPGAYAKQVAPADWEPLGQDRWVAPASAPPS